MDNIDLNILHFKICGDEIRTHADSVFIPVEVTDAEDRLSLRHDVVLKAVFYNELRKKDDWIDSLHKICQTRVLRFLKEHSQQPQINIDDKLALLFTDPKKLTSE